MKLIVAESSAKCLALARIAKIVTDEVWRYCVTPTYSIERALKRRPSLTDDSRPRVKWGSWRKVLDGVREAEAIYIATDPDRPGDYLAQAVRATILEQWPDRPVHRLRLQDITATSFNRGYQSNDPFDQGSADAHEAELAINRVVADGLQRIIGGGGRALAPAVVDIRRLHGVQRYHVQASGIAFTSSGPWDGVEISGDRIRPAITSTTVEVPPPSAPTIQRVIAEAPQRAMVAWNALQQLYAIGMVTWGSVDGPAVHEALRGLGAEPGGLPSGGDVRPVDLSIAPSEAPPHLYETYLTLWCIVLASGATPALVERTYISIEPNLIATSTAIQRPGYMALLVDRPRPRHHVIPETLVVESAAPRPWGMTEGELFTRFESLGLRYHNPALLLKVMENRQLIEYQGDQIIPTDQAVEHVEALQRSVPELTNPTFFQKCRERIDRVADRELDRAEVVAEYRRWMDGVKAPYDEWKSGSANA